MRKGQQQIRCSSGVSIAGRIDSRPQVISVFIPVLSSPIPNPFLSNQVSVHVILHSSSHGLLKLCPNPNLGVFSSPHTVMATIKQLLMSSVMLQIQGLPPQKTRGPRGQQQGQWPETVKSGGDVHPPHGDDTGMALQGETLNTVLAHFYLNDFNLIINRNPMLMMFYVVHMYFLCLYPCRKRRTPSPGRRRRSPSLPRRRRSPSPPRRRYRRVHFISSEII